VLLLKEKGCYLMNACGVSPRVSSTAERKEEYWNETTAGGALLFGRGEIKK